MSASAREVLKKTLTAIESETVPCERCNGYGYHHGFGEHGHDPDWCVVCGGAQVVPAHDAEKTPEILLAALSAAGLVIVPREPTEAMIKAYYHAMDGTHPTAKMNPSKALVDHHIKAQKRYRAMLSAAEGKK